MGLTTGASRTEACGRPMSSPLRSTPPLPTLRGTGTLFDRTDLSKFENRNRQRKEPVRSLCASQCVGSFPFQASSGCAFTSDCFFFRYRKQKQSMLPPIPGWRRKEVNNDETSYTRSLTENPTDLFAR